MYGVTRRSPVCASQLPQWRTAMRPFYNFLVETDFQDLHLEDDTVANDAARTFRRTLYRILAECELDDVREDWITRMVAKLTKNATNPLRANESAFVDLLSKLGRFFDAETCHATPPFPFGDVRKKDTLQCTPKKKNNDSPPVLASTPKTVTGVPTLAPTPLKFGTRDLESEAQTQHCVMDRKLAAELRRPLWHTTDDSFFDSFFPAINDIPLPAKFPRVAVEQAVVQWFPNYYTLFRRSEAASPHPPTRDNNPWVWNTSPTRFLIHPEPPKRKVDLFITSERAASRSSAVARAEDDAPDDRTHWSDVVVSPTTPGRPLAPSLVVDSCTPSP
ncbi:hypothetical protein FN846DRAFT_911789 [Sphaerosporella brunnea]|uniref:Uncharacterized protein n=1 Tax=Sphaerosporella brunnea TaxID=1250544 RepID=A0A5J5EL03_9PEZI|nr:hypothetical protein FN846DRAFT_911789 [Sphaerosporella brunnea]